jgi:hypothetical protein
MPAGYLISQLVQAMKGYFQATITMRNLSKKVLEFYDREVL